MIFKVLEQSIALALYIGSTTNYKNFFRSFMGSWQDMGNRIGRELLEKAFTSTVPF